MELQPLRIAGNIMNKPIFGGMQRMNSELMNPIDQVLPLCVLDLILELSLPEGEDRDHWYSNLMVEGLHTSAISKIGSYLVIGFCGDPLIDRQQDFAQMLVRHGVQINGRFDMVGFHGIEIVNPKMDALFVLVGGRVRDVEVNPAAVVEVYYDGKPPRDGGRQFGWPVDTDPCYVSTLRVTSLETTGFHGVALGFASVVGNSKVLVTVPSGLRTRFVCA
ncbi:probable carboxylesterase 9 [Fagus crenata]